MTFYFTIVLIIVVEIFDSSTANQIMERLLAYLCFEITASRAELFGLELDSVHTRQTGETFQQSRENPANILSERRKEKKAHFRFCPSDPQRQ